MKIYELNGRFYWFKEGEQPEGAVEVKPAKAEAPVKEVKPANKTRKVATK